MPEMVKVTVDGIPVEVEKGSPVIEATRKVGTIVPHYCYHPGLTIAGNCRMCLVEIEKMPKLVTSCTTQAADGMVIHTRSDKVKKGIAGVEEFLLANHPLDCPICDQAGECRLQEYSYRHGGAESRFREHRLQFKKGAEVGPHVILDAERCIMCTRCVRFCDEITKTSELGVFQRGLRNEIGIFPGRPLANNYSGNVVDLCPVGALTLSEFRFRKRVWFLREIPSVCGSCANGCNVKLGTNENRIWRLTPRENLHVNGWWMCDEGRLSYQRLDETPHLQNPEARDGYATTAAARAQAAPPPPAGVAGARTGEPAVAAISGMASAATAHQIPRDSRSREGSPFVTLRLQEAVARLVERLKSAAPGTAAVAASANLTLEDLWVLKRLATEAIPGLRVVVPQKVRGSDDGFLIRADKTANRRGAELLGFDVDAGGESTRSLVADVASGRVTTLIQVGDEAAALPDAEPGMAATRRPDLFLVSIGPFATGHAAAAHLRIPAAAYGEFEGTWVNFSGRAQRVRRAVTARAASLPYWQVFSLLLQKLGAKAPYQLSAEVLREMAAAVPAFAGLSWASLGATGMQAPGAGPAGERAPEGLPKQAVVPVPHG